MRAFALNQFLGELPKVAPKLIGKNNAQSAINCHVNSGQLTPFNQPETDQAIAQGSTPTTIYDLDGTWVSWDQDMDVQPSLLPDVYEELVEQYCTGGSTTTLIDTKINFVSSGVKPGMSVVNITNGTTSVILTITTTTQPNDTLTFGSTTATTVGNLYQVVNQQSVDDRFYYTGDGEPKQSNKSLALPLTAVQGPANEYTLGIRKPSTILNVGLTGTPDGTVIRTTSYTYTFVNLFGEESEPATSAEPIDIEGGQTVVLSNIKISVNDMEGIEYVRIYRSVIGTNSFQYQMVEQLPISDFINVTDTYTDTVSDDLLGLVLASQIYKAPVETLKGLCRYNNMVYAGFDKNTVYFSEPNKPHAWPYPIDLPYQVVSIAAYDNQLVVGTTDYTYVISGEDPATVSVIPLPTREPCLFKKGMVATSLGVMYVCPGGIMQVNNSSAHQVMSTQIIDKDFFPAAEPVEIIEFDSKLFIQNTTTSTGVFFDLTKLEVGLFRWALEDTTVFSGWVNKDSELFAVNYDGVSYTIEAWDRSSTPLELTWKSKQIAHRVSGDYVSGKVVADSPVTFSYFIDGAEQVFSTQPKIASDSGSFRLPSRSRGRVFEFQVKSTGRISYAGLGSHNNDFA